MFHSRARAFHSPAVHVFEDSLIHCVRLTESGLFKKYNSFSARYSEPSEILFLHQIPSQIPFFPIYFTGILELLLPFTLMLSLASVHNNDIQVIQKLLAVYSLVSNKFQRGSFFPLDLAGRFEMLKLFGGGGESTCEVVPTH